LNTHQQPKAQQAITIAYHQEPRPVLQNEDLPINSTGEAEKKTKLNISTTGWLSWDRVSKALDCPDY